MPIYTDSIQTAAAIIYGILINSGKSQFVFYYEVDSSDISIYPCGVTMDAKNAIIINDIPCYSEWSEDLDIKFKKIRSEIGVQNHSKGLVVLKDLIIAYD